MNFEDDFYSLLLEQYNERIRRKYPDEYPDDEEEEDVVNAPKHYQLFPEYGIEVRDLMILLARQLDDECYPGMIVSDYIQAMQYLLRWHKKNGVEDIKKARFYINKILEQLEKENNND